MHCAHGVCRKLKSLSKKEITHVLIEFQCRKKSLRAPKPRARLGVILWCLAIGFNVCHKHLPMMVPFWPTCGSPSKKYIVCSSEEDLHAITEHHKQQWGQMVRVGNVLTRNKMRLIIYMPVIQSFLEVSIPIYI